MKSFAIASVGVCRHNRRASQECLKNVGTDLGIATASGRSLNLERLRGLSPYSSVHMKSPTVCTGASLTGTALSPIIVGCEMNL